MKAYVGETQVFPQDGSHPLPQEHDFELRALGGGTWELYIVETDKKYRFDSSEPLRPVLAALSKNLVVKIQEQGITIGKDAILIIKDMV